MIELDLLHHPLLSTGDCGQGSQVDLNGCLSWPTESDLKLIYNLAL